MLLGDKFHNFDVLQLWLDCQLLLHRLCGCINPLLNHTLFQDRLPLPLFRLNTQSSLTLTIFRHVHQRCSKHNHLEIPISTQLQPSMAQSSSLKVDVCPPSDSCPQAAVPGTPNILLNNADPSQLQSYPPMVCDIIERTKQFSHCDIASVNSFPL